MSYRNTVSRLTLASLTAAALAAPAATAMPTDPGTGAAQDSRQTAGKDLRSEAAADPSRAPLGHPRLVAPPTWPEHPLPIDRAPAQLDVADDGGGDVPVELILVGGALVLGGGMAVTAVRLRARTAH